MARARLREEEAQKQAATTEQERKQDVTGLSSGSSLEATKTIAKKTISSHSSGQFGKFADSSSGNSSSRTSKSSVQKTTSSAASVSSDKPKSGTSTRTSKLTSMQEPAVQHSPAVEQKQQLETYPTLSMNDMCTRFFKAVSDFQEANGRGGVMVRKNDDGVTVSFLADYCNYECRDCANRIGSYLSIPGFRMAGGDNDMFFYELQKVKCFENESSLLSVILSALHRTLPFAEITGQSVKDGFCSVQFHT